MHAGSFPRHRPDGRCAAPVDDSAPTALQAEQQASKDQLKAAAETQLRSPEAATTSNLISPMTTDPGGGGRVVVKLAEVAAMGTGPLCKEGQAKGKKSYTCGPAATRNMVAAMYRHRDGAYKNCSAFGHWTTSRPADKTEYLSDVIADTAYHQSMIADIDTEELDFWNGKALDHFDLVSGYDTTSSPKRIWVGEEWYGSSSYGNSYGFHWVSLASAFRAVNKTSIHGVVS